MRNKAWAKTLLEIYKYLETICGAIDDLVRRTSLSGFGNSLDTRDSADRIIELTSKKQRLINMKIIIEDTLASLNISDVKLLTLFYVDEVTAKNLSEILGINIRTFFRRKDISLTKFANSMKSAGFDHIRLNKIFENEHWIINTYKHNLSTMLNRGGNDKEAYTCILNTAMKELKSFGKKKYVYGY